MSTRPLNHPASATSKVLCAIAGVALGVTGCSPAPNGGSEEETGSARDAVEAASVEGDSEAIVLSAVGASAAGLALPSARSDGAAAFYAPKGCLKITTEEPRIIVFAFNECSGPYGLRRVHGTLRVQYKVEQNGPLTLNLQASDLQLNGATFTWAAEASITAKQGGEREMSWRASLRGQTATGRAFDHASEKKIAWTLGADCFEAEGRTDGNLTGRRVSVETRVQRCGDACPSADSKIVVTYGDTLRSITVSFDGTNQAQVADSSGRTSALRLACGL